MINIMDLVTLVTTKIRMALNTKSDFSLMIDNTLSDYTFATTMKGHLQGNVLAIFITIWLTKMVFF